MTCQPQQLGVLGISFWDLVGMDWDKGCEGGCAVLWDIKGWMLWTCL